MSYRGPMGWCLGTILMTVNLSAAADDLRLVEAVKNQDQQSARALLKQKIDVKRARPDGTTALHWAVQWDYLDIANLLIGAGADVTAANDFGVTPLSLACVNGNAAMIDLLLKAGANPSGGSPTGETPLMTAARTGRVDAVKSLLDYGADANAQDLVRGQTALMWAAAEGHVDVVRLLVERGADVRARSKKGFTPLLFAARTGQVQLLQLLIKAGADVKEAAADGTNALTVATVRSHTTLAKFLLEQGADPNTGPGFMPLHWAVGEWSSAETVTDRNIRPENTEWSSLDGLRGSAKTDFVELLLAHGADPNARAEGTPPRYGAGRARGGLFAGATPFFIAAKVGDVNVMRLLVAAGADPLLLNAEKATPLMVAAGLGYKGLASVPESEALEAVKLCVELGNDVNAADSFGDTALHGAAYRGDNAGSLSIIQFLVDKGAKLNVKDQAGWTPLTIVEGIYYNATDTRSESTAALFRKLGAEPSPPNVERNAGIADPRHARTLDRSLRVQ